MAVTVAGVGAVGEGFGGVKAWLEPQQVLLDPQQKEPSPQGVTWTLLFAEPFCDSQSTLPPLPLDSPGPRRRSVPRHPSCKTSRTRPPPTTCQCRTPAA